MKKLIILSAMVTIVSCNDEEDSKVSKSFKNVLKATANKADAGSHGDLSKALNKAANEINEDADSVRQQKGKKAKGVKNDNSPSNNPASQAANNLSKAINNKIEAEGGHNEFRNKLSKALDKAAKEINEEAEKERNK